MFVSLADFELLLKKFKTESSPMLFLINWGGLAVHFTGVVAAVSVDHKAKLAFHGNNSLLFDLTKCKVRYGEPREANEGARDAVLERYESCFYIELEDGRPVLLFELKKQN